MNRELTRSLDDRRLAGVCGGLAAYFDIDSTIIRIVFALLILAYGSGLLAYILAWILIPEASGIKSADTIEYRSLYDHTRRLYRSRRNRKIAGVCGGIAEYFNIDATIIRILLVFTALFYGSGFLIYAVCAFIIPEQPY